jgi:hypothetical protein
VGGAALAIGVVLVGTLATASDSCREWRTEHLQWKTEVLRRYLRGAAERDLDAAVFELLQREAYLTSCDMSVEGGRDDLVGWRLVGRTPEDYGSAVVESILERAGFDLSLRELLDGGPPAVARSSGARSGRGIAAR